MTTEPTDVELATGDDRVIEMVEMMMRGHTMKAIAQHFDVSDRTIYRWKTTGLGKELLARAKREAIDRAHRAVSTASGAAASTLTEIATDKKARRSDRVRAAEAILRASGVSELSGLLSIEEEGEARVAAAATLAARFTKLEERLSFKEPVVEVGELKAV
jgi:transposase-like protein